MKNIEYLISMIGTPNYNEEEINNIIRKYCENNGYEKTLSMCMEELAELIEVITEFQISGKLDIIHLEEELVDCHMVIRFLECIFNHENFEIKHEYRIYDKTDNILIVCINNLAGSITKLSKCIRQKPNAFKEVCTVIRNIDETITNVLQYFHQNYNANVVTQIYMHKIKRIEDRNLSYMTDMYDDDLK